jgi:formate hydrogenlyase transcriptional activator
LTHTNAADESSDPVAIAEHRCEAAGFERLISVLSATFIDLPAERVDEHIEQALRRVVEFLDLDRSNVFQLAVEDGQLRTTHQWVRPGFPAAPKVSAKELPWAAARMFKGETLIMERLDQLPPEAWREREFFERHGPRSTVSIPLRVGGSVIGALAFGALRQERPWPANVINRLHLVAQIVAAALARKNAEFALRRAYAFEHLIAVHSTRFIDLPAEAIDGAIQDVLADVAEFLGVDRATVLQTPHPCGAFERSHQWAREGFPPIEEAETEESYPWMMEQVLRRREVVAFARRDELPAVAGRDRARLERHGVRSVAIFPLAAGGAVLGVLAFAALRGERPWGPELLDRLRLIAEVVANAVARKQAEQQLRAALAENQRLRERLEAENVYLQEEIREARDFGDIVGQSATLRAALNKVDQVASTDAPVLLLGETGTGKELLARAIHARSRRSREPLIAVNCAALPTTLIESELFGHEKGAFTGATQAKPGRFELAHGGTLFLDEIGDMEPALQTKLLRVLQDGEIHRLGSTVTRKVDVRIVAATNRNLSAAIRDGRFRSDLYYRLGVFPVEVPSLRERAEDIPLLVWYFVQGRQRALGRTIDKIPRAAMERLQAYDWPGNVRELQNVIDRALIVSTGPVLRIEDALGLAGRTPHTPESGTASDGLRDTERAHILRVLERSGWRLEGRGQAADRLGLRPSTLRNRMKKLGIRRPAPSSG